MSLTDQNPTANLADRWLARSGKFFMPTWLLFVCLLITWGWSNRDEGYLNAESGLGYFLGILGGSMMLGLLTYSLRKRVRLLNRVLTVKFWFQLHMMLGILGPVSIIFHSNFDLGSPNSTVAMICMLLVAGSGIIGRYLYNHIHFGLYGEKIKLTQVLADFQLLQKDINQLAVTEKQKVATAKIFSAMEEIIQEQTHKQSWLSAVKNRNKTRKISTSLNTLMNHLDNYHQNKETAQINIQKIHNQLKENSLILQAALRKLPGLQISEQLFSLWHVIHIPIFILMIITSVTHVVVVHMY
jgi:hypothetical protein